MAENTGGIYYTVDADTQPLIDSVGQVDRQMDRLQGSFDQTDKAASKTGRSMNATGKEAQTTARSVSALSSSMQAANSSANTLGGGLNNTTRGIRQARQEASGAEVALGKMGAALAGYFTVRAAMGVIQLADSYGEMAERLRAATSSTEEYNMVQARLLANANATYRPLAEAQELFVRTSSVLRDMGYNTSQALDITDSLSLAFVRNSASGERAENAIRAVSASLQRGKVDADAWASIIAATPTIVDSLAEATGRTTTEIRQLGVSGQLTGQQLAEGLRKGHDENAKAAADMAVTVRDAYNNLINTLTVYIGTANEASGATGLLAKAMEAVTNGFRFSVGMLTDQEKLNELFNERQLLIKTLNGVEGTWRANMPATNRHRERLAEVERELLEIQNRRIEQQKEESRQQDRGAPAAPDTSAEGQKRVKALEQERDALRLTGVARAQLRAEQSLGENATAGEIARARELAAEMYTLSEAQKSAGQSRKQVNKEAEKEARDAAQAAEANAKAIQGLTTELEMAGLKGRELAEAQALLKLNPYATPEQVAQVRALAVELNKVAEAERLKQQLRAADPMVDAQSSYQAELESLRQLNEAKLLEDQRYLELKGIAEENYSARVNALEEERFRRQSMTNQLLIDSLNSLQQAGTSALTGLLTGTSNAQEAMRALAGSILQHAVGALVEMGVQYVKSMVMGQAAQSAAAISAAATGTAMASAYAPAAAMASLASFGSNAAPAAAGITSTMGLAQGLALTGRQYGGPVDASKMYRINENGAPEVFNSANGRQYMLPNQRGHVVSNADATAGGSANTNIITINVDSAGNSSVDGGTSSMDSMNMANALRNVVVDELERQNRQGGMLWAQRQNQNG